MSPIRSVSIKWMMCLVVCSAWGFAGGGVARADETAPAPAAPAAPADGKAKFEELLLSSIKDLNATIKQQQETSRQQHELLLKEIKDSLSQRSKSVEVHVQGGTASTHLASLHHEHKCPKCGGGHHPHEGCGHKHFCATGQCMLVESCPKCGVVCSGTCSTCGVAAVACPPRHVCVDFGKSRIYQRNCVFYLELQGTKRPGTQIFVAEAGCDEHGTRMLQLYSQPCDYSDSCAPSEWFCQKWTLGHLSNPHCPKIILKQRTVCTEIQCAPCLTRLSQEPHWGVIQQH